MSKLHRTLGNTRALLHSRIAAIRNDKVVFTILDSLWSRALWSLATFRIVTSGCGWWCTADFLACVALAFLVIGIFGQQRVCPDSHWKKGSRHALLFHDSTPSRKTLMMTNCTLALLGLLTQWGSVWWDAGAKKREIPLKLQLKLCLQTVFVRIMT